MIFKPTKQGGRIACGDTLYGKFCVEWDKKGNIIDQSIEIRHSEDFQYTKKENECSCKKKTEITLKDRSIGLVKIILSFIPWLQTKKEDKTKRRNICLNCPMSVIINNKPIKCKQCGCYLKYKTRLKDEKCPMGLWK